jgi:hypothetical protein
VIRFRSSLGQKLLLPCPELYDLGEYSDLLALGADIGRTGQGHHYSQIMASSAGRLN